MRHFMIGSAWRSAAAAAQIVAARSWHEDAFDLPVERNEEAAMVERTEFYHDLVMQLSALLEGEHDPVANAANTAALPFQTMPNLNWAGFYFLREGKELVLGPFQGKPACVRIAAGRGVCGAAVEQGKPVLVEDVHAFPGHIACDDASRSELVVPLFRDGHVIGVLDLDSPAVGRFDALDQAGMENIAALYISASAEAI
jgi:L-methionine (R)-S-oxide reductase